MKKAISIIICTVTVVLLLASCGGAKVYRVAVDTSFSPFCSVDSQGNAVGFEIDLLNAIAKEKGFTVEYCPVGYPEALEELESGDVDAAMAAIVPTDELSEKFDFSDMYYNNEYALAVEKGKDSAFIEIFNEGLSELRSNGRYKAMYAKYFGDSPEDIT